MNIADKLTFFRIFIIPFFILSFMYDYGNVGLSQDFFKILAALFFILGAISDYMDGYYARKYNLVSTAGKLWDPVADKMLVSSALIMLSAYGYIPFLITIIIISREFIVTGIRMVALSENKVIAASRLGKWKTGFQLAYIITILVFLCFEILFDYYIPKHIVTEYFLKYNGYIINVLAILTVYYTIRSGFDYYLKNRKMAK